MNTQELSSLTDDELLREAQKEKLSPVWTALFIGFMIGIIVYSVVKSSLSFLTLIPLYIAYRLVKGSQKNDELDRLLKERNLK